MSDCSSTTHLMTVGVGVDGTCNTNWTFVIACRVWISSGDTDMNDGNNYHPIGALAAGNNLVFNGDSVINATATGSITVTTIQLGTEYTGTFNDGGQTITLAGQFDISSGGGFTATGSLIMTGTANLTFKNTGSQSTSSWDVDLQNTGNLLWTGYRNLGSLTCAASGKTTTLADG